MKKLLVGVCVIVVIIVIVLVIGISKLGPIIKTAVNSYGPKITKTEVSLADVGVSILKGEVRLKGFVLGNPKGFKSSHAITVGSIYVDVDEKSLAGDPIIIDKIEVSGPEITYEKSAKTDNFQQLLKNIQSGAKTSSESSTQKSGEDTGGKKIIIRDFILEGGKVNLATSLLGGKPISAKLPDIQLKDLGKEKGGAKPEEVFSRIFAVLYEKISSPDVTKIFNDQISPLKDDAEKQLKKAGDDIKAAADKGLKGLLNR